MRATHARAGARFRVPGAYGLFSAMSLADGAGLRKQFAANDAVPSSAYLDINSHNQQHGVKTDA
jgi:hypothetical protein